MNKSLMLIFLIEAYKLGSIQQKLNDETAKRNLGKTEADEILLEHLGDYTLNKYYHINKQLRDKKITDNNYHQHIKSLKKITNNPTEHKFSVYRGINNKEFSDFKKGDIIHDLGFTSTTTKKRVAENFKEEGTDDDKNGTLFKIHITPGIKGSYVDNYSKRKGESEFLLHPGTKFRVGKTHINKKTGKPGHIDLHIHSQEE